MLAKPRSLGAAKFPFLFEKNGRVGRIKRWKSVFGTYFQFAGKKFRNSFKTFEAAHAFLDREFARLDTDPGNSLSLFPVQHDIKTYHELEHLLREGAHGATLREAVEFFVAHRQHKKFSPKSVFDCITEYLAHERARNLSSNQIRTLEKHLRPFKAGFGQRKIHALTAHEIATWLANRKTDKGEPWSAKTRRNVRGSLVSLSLFARDVAKAIPDLGKTEFQNVRNPKRDAKGEVEIYKPAEIAALLAAATVHDMELIPGIVLGCFQGLRPDEFHAENADRKPLPWSAINWHDNLLHVKGQKVRSKKTRDIPLHAVTKAWLEPLRPVVGDSEQDAPIWKYAKAFDDKMRSLCEKAKVPRIYDGFRHSYASYRVRQLRADLALLAAEMGNSPTEIINSYNRNVTDEQAVAWFNTNPPSGYQEKVRVFLASRQTAGL